jgi:hypothetical protein
MRESSSQSNGRVRGSCLTSRNVLGGLLGAIAGLAGACVAVGCGGVGDDAYVPVGRTPLNQVDLANAPFCVGTCLPDYGSQRIDCSAEAGLEFFPVPVLDGEAASTITGFYSYTDNTSDFLVSGPTGYDPSLPNYAPPAVVVNDRPSCQNGVAVASPTGQNVHHLRGGLFREWGGGMGRRLVDFVTTANPPCIAGPSREGDPEYCPDADPRIESVADLPGNATLRSRFYGMIADLRGWEGISFWARQGPNNTGGIRVYVGDRQLDEDISYFESAAGLDPICRRARECGCDNHRPCTQGDGPLASGTYCWDPNEIPSIAAVRQEYIDRGEDITRFDQRYACGATACNVLNPTFMEPDPVFATAAVGGTAECLPYKLTSDLEDSFCFDPNDPAAVPPDGPERCGDGFAKGVTLSSDWQFFTVPFTELRQEGYGQEFQTLDLSKITLVRFTWTQGWVDVWLDDVRFYRHASGAALAE